MPRDGSQQYSVPAGTDGVANYTIESTKYNAFIHDVEADLNAPRPISAGGTGGTSSDTGLFNLSGEKAAQIVTNWDSMLWAPGSFYAATTATGIAPVAGHKFAGICYINEPLANPPTNQNLVCEATDLTDPANPVQYLRIMTAGVWSAWTRLGAGAVRYDVAQTLTATQQSQARANINVTTKNFIVNGAMMVTQENGGSAGTANGYYPVDQFFLSYANSGVQTAQNIVSPTPGGSTVRLRVTASTPDASVAAGDVCQVGQKIEGFRVAELRLGTAQTRTFTLQFGVKAPAGTYCVAFSNANGTRNYVAEYVIAAGEANTDVVKSITLTGDITGSWDTASGAGLCIGWVLMCGSTYQQAPNVWSGAVTFAVATINQFNFMGTGGNTFELFDVSLTEGGVAPPFSVRLDYASELITCQRYYYKSPAREPIGLTISGATPPGYFYKVLMRAAPAATAILAVGAGAAGTFSAVEIGIGSLSFFNSGTAWTVGTGLAFNPIVLNARL